MIGVYIVGEDDVTRHVIYRILSYCGAGRFTVLMELPARGGEIKNKIPNFNQLAMKFPVILLTDLDADNCAPELKRKLLGGLEQAENLVFNVAVDEAEAWLMADRMDLQNISLSMSISYLVPDCRNKEEQKPVWKCSLVVSLLIF